MKYNRIGLFGGSFNPPHLGHLIMAEEFVNRFSIDKLFFIPVGIPPHKNVELAPKEDRFKMTVLATADNEKFFVSDYEIKKEEPSYTYITVLEFKNRFYNSEIFLLLGYDSLLEIKTWKNYNLIFENAKLCAFAREGFDIRGFDKEILRKILIIDDIKINISSSMIRERIKKGLPYRYFLHPRVYDYIVAKGFYR
ncbi:MAG: nicotinate (nicotinamide) nucleotide adenylyltransferase [Caldiserica bacterium]|nr:MAG: nicotinate (nicotinamide) nucleotide adenylyltransferase [Caldisericota bacterium]